MLRRTGQPDVYLLNEGAADTGWNTVGVDLKSYAGRTIALLLGVMNDGLNGSTSMAIDGAQTQICVPQ